MAGRTRRAETQWRRRAKPALRRAMAWLSVRDAPRQPGAGQAPPCRRQGVRIRPARAAPVRDRHPKGRDAKGGSAERSEVEPGRAGRAGTASRP